jgi:hypothetical protein
MVPVMRRIPIPVGVAFGLVVAIVVVLSILNSLNGGLGHTPYIAMIWTVIGLIGLSIYYAARAAIRALRLRS